MVCSAIAIEESKSIVTMDIGWRWIKDDEIYAVNEEKVNVCSLFTCLPFPMLLLANALLWTMGFSQFCWKKWANHQATHQLFLPLRSRKIKIHVRREKWWQDQFVAFLETFIRVHLSYLHLFIAVDAFSPRRYNLKVSSFLKNTNSSFISLGKTFRNIGWLTSPFSVSVDCGLVSPISSMYGIFTYIFHKNQPFM